MPTLDAFDRRKPFGLTSNPIPVHGPCCRQDRASLDLGVARRLLQPNTTRGHTQRAIDPRTRVELLAPLLAGTNRCRLRWLTDASPHPEPASHDSHAEACAHGVPLAWTGQVAGRRTREKAGALLDERCACPSRSAPCTRVTCAIRCEAWTASPLVVQIKTHPVSAASRKDALSGEVEVLSTVAKPVREQRG
jgi:hypothetical protein